MIFEAIFIGRIMKDEQELAQLLREIRDGQREHLEEYKKVTQRSLELQQQAVNRQEQLAKTYRIALIVSAVLIVAIIGLVIYLFSYLPPRYR